MGTCLFSAAVLPPLLVAPGLLLRCRLELHVPAAKVHSITCTKEIPLIIRLNRIYGCRKSLHTRLVEPSLPATAVAAVSEDDRPRVSAAAVTVAASDVVFVDIDTVLLVFVVGVVNVLESNFSSNTLSTQVPDGLKSDEDAPQSVPSQEAAKYISH